MATMWASLLVLLCALQQAFAYRPVQHCKSIGDAGHYSACAAITQYYNATTGVSDLYLRYHWFRFRNTKRGWHSFALGRQMEGAFMLIMYGDPNNPAIPMTVDVRSADGHAPPRPIAEIDRFIGTPPRVDIVTSVFEEYKGELTLGNTPEKPSHVGICEAIIRGYEKWPGSPMKNSSTQMDMIWSSNYKQDMEDDFSHGRGLEAHPFGLGFGFLFVDMLNAATPEPMFGPLDEMAGTKGAAEESYPGPPSTEELLAGATYIAQQSSNSNGNTPPPVPVTPPTSSEDSDKEEQPVEQPVRTVLGKTIRDWMWHLHGLLMTIAFLVLYPLGTYLIRSGNNKAFNQHWTVQSLATVSLAIGSLIGYINSYGISVKHQYIGIALTLAVVAQIVLGWRHHVFFVATKRKNWLSTSHIWLGRIFLPLGFVNIILGMLLRGYGWFTMILVLICIGLESAFLSYVLVRASRKKTAPADLRGNQSGPPRGDEAEEYFQLAGEDEFSDSDGEQDEARATKAEEQQRQAERLRRLDKV